MKYTQIASFKNETKLYPLYMILSKDNFERKEIVDFLLGMLRRGGHSVDTFQGNKITAEELQGEIYSLGLFSKRRILLIHDADKISKQVQEVITKCAFKEVFIILEAETFNRNTKFYKEFEAAGALVDIPELKLREKIASMVGILQEKARLAHKTIDQQVSTLMVNQLGTDQALLHNELEKLICYVGERQAITAEDVRVMCGVVPQETIWQLGDAIFKKDAQAALRIIHGLLSSDLPFLVLLRQIRSQVQTKFQVCSTLASGGTPADIERQFPYMKGYVLEQNIKQATEYGLPSFKKAMIAIDQAELEAKNGQVSPELLMIKLTS